MVMDVSEKTVSRTVALDNATVAALEKIAAEMFFGNFSMAVRHCVRRTVEAQQPQPEPRS